MEATPTTDTTTTDESIPPPSFPEGAEAPATGADADAAPAAPTTTWSDVAGASAENPTPPRASRTKKVTELLRVPVTQVALAKIARDNANDDKTKKDLTDKLEGLREDVKALKGEIDVIDTRMSERHEAVRSQVQTLKGEWLQSFIFETNTVQYTDPDTFQVVHERSMTAFERQEPLPFDVGNGSTNGSAHDDEEDNDLDDEPADETDLNDEDPIDPDDVDPTEDGDDDSGVATDSDSSGELPPSGDDETAITDPVGTLSGAAAKDAPKKRTRKKKP